MPNPDYQYSGSKPQYDTQLGYQYVRPVLPRSQMSPSYNLSQFRATGPVDAQLKEANEINCIMNRTYENRNCDANA